MNYTKTSGEFIKCFLPILKKNKRAQASAAAQAPAAAAETDILKVLYNDIYKAHRESIKNSCLKGVLKKLTKTEPANQPEIYNSKFFPTYIKKYIKENEYSTK